MEKEIKCTCGKLLAIERDGKIFLKCRGCKHEIEVTPTRQMPRTAEPTAIYL